MPAEPPTEPLFVLPDAMLCVCKIERACKRIAPFAALIEGARSSVWGLRTVTSASVSFFTSANVKAPDS